VLPTHNYLPRWWRPCVCARARVCVWAYHSQANNLSLGSQKNRVSRVSTHKQMVGNSTWEQMVTTTMTTTTIQSDDTFIIGHHPVRWDDIVIDCSLDGQKKEKKKKKDHPTPNLFEEHGWVFAPQQWRVFIVPYVCKSYTSVELAKKGKVALSDLDYKGRWIGNSIILYKVFKWVYWI
jgi:hypothetical protein